MVRIIEVPFLLAWPPGAYAAQVILPERIFVLKGQHLTPALIAHELGHLADLRRMGLLRYWATYLWLLARFGYEAHPMERAADMAAQDPAYLAQAVEIIGRYAVR